MLGVAARVWWPLLAADRTAASLGTAAAGGHGGMQSGAMRILRTDF
jgi:hypothetical protein